MSNRQLQRDSEDSLVNFNTQDEERLPDTDPKESQLGSELHSEDKFKDKGFIV